MRQREQARLLQVEQAGQELAAGQIAGGAEQDDDVGLSGHIRVDLTSLGSVIAADVTPPAGGGRHRT